jgi:nucleoside-diphosphate-sugar epimerase
MFLNNTIYSNNQEEKMKILITGNCGYVGSVLTRECLLKGYQVIGYDSLMHGKEHMASLLSNNNLKQVEGDIRDLEKLEPLIKEADIIVNLAAIVRVDHCPQLKEEMNEVNTQAAINIAKLCKTHGKKFFQASSCSIYGLLEGKEEIDETAPLSPTTIYAQTKADAESGILKVNPNAIICRFATACGESLRMRYDLFINEITRDAYADKKIELFDPEVWRCYIHTKDMAQAVLYLIENKITGTLNIGSTNQNITKSKIIEILKQNIPDFQVSTLRDQKDPRDYKVSFKKLEFQGFQAQKSIPQGIQEMINHLSLSGVDPHDHKFSNYK